jgi:hypothetical protein
MKGGGSSRYTSYNGGGLGGSSPSSSNNVNMTKDPYGALKANNGNNNMRLLAELGGFKVETTPTQTGNPTLFFFVCPVWFCVCVFVCLAFGAIRKGGYVC